VKRPCGDDSQPVADRSDDDGAQREARNRACVSSLCTTMPPFSIYLARCAQ
jgi:hypothetical protein